MRVEYNGEWQHDGQFSQFKWSTQVTIKQKLLISFDYNHRYSLCEHSADHFLTLVVHLLGDKIDMMDKVNIKHGF